MNKHDKQNLNNFVKKRKKKKKKKGAKTRGSSPLLWNRWIEINLMQATGSFERAICNVEKRWRPY